MISRRDDSSDPHLTLPNSGSSGIFKESDRFYAIVGLYDRYLALRVRRHPAESPDHVALVITERDLLTKGAYQTFESFLDWAVTYGASRISVYVGVVDLDAAPTLRQSIEAIDAPLEMAIRDPEATEPATTPIQVGIGLGGKHEFARAVQSLCHSVELGTLKPHEIDANLIEDRLIFSDEPDLMIKTGAERLSDFMIWQSVYSELYFTDVNWQNFRLRDYLRAIRAFQSRIRRFGE